ncbi:MAG: hypothetical protein V1847_02475 [Candidatus Diapherotrites archaeon]
MFWDVLGALGLVILLLAFILNAGKHTKRNTFLFNGLNLIGSGLLAGYAFQIGAWIFVVLETIWVFFAAYFLLRLTHHKVRNRKVKKGA